MNMLSLMEGAYAVQISDRTKGWQQKKKCLNTSVFFSDYESVNPGDQTQSKYANNIDHICTCCISLMMTEPFITLWYSMRSAASVFCWCKNLALSWQISLPLIWVSNCSLLTNLWPLCEWWASHANVLHLTGLVLLDIWLLCSGS